MRQTAFNSVKSLVQLEPMRISILLSKNSFARSLARQPAPISTQTLQRDRHAEYMATLALIATSLDKFATEIRALAEE